VVGHDSSAVPDQVFVLVDYDNFYHDHVCDERDDHSWLLHEINLLVTESLRLLPEVSRVDFRLYGGWLAGNVLTKRGSALCGTITQTPYFPIRAPSGSRLIHGEVVLATRLLQLPSIEWGNTLRQRRGLPRIRFNGTASSPLCSQKPHQCPIEILRHFTVRRNRTCPVPGCTVDRDHVFAVTEQKMVDSMMTCDLLHLARLADVGGVIVCTDDTDVLPTLAAVADIAQGKRIRLAARKNAGVVLDDHMLVELGVQKIEWGAA
jgi:hypothetical protein